MNIYPEVYSLVGSMLANPRSGVKTKYEIKKFIFDDFLSAEFEQKLRKQINLTWKRLSKNIVWSRR